MMENRQKIQQLQDQLLQLGYHQYQLDSIVHDMIGTDLCDDLSQEQLEQLVEAMTTYVTFAQKCRKTRSKK